MFLSKFKDCVLAKTSVSEHGESCILGRRAFASSTFDDSVEIVHLFAHPGPIPRATDSGE